MAQNVFEKIKNSDLSAMSSAELEKLRDEVLDTGISKHMTKAQFNATMKKLHEALVAAKAKENGQPQPQAATDEPKATDEEKEKFAANIEALNSLDKGYEAGSENRKALNHLLVVTEDGKGEHLQEEIVETAKLKVLTDNAENDQPLDQEAYKKAVDKEILAIVGKILDVSSKDNKDANANAKNWAEIIDKQAQVSYQAASGVLSTRLMDAKAKADQLANKYENRNFLAGFTSRLNNVVKSAEKKLGKFFKQTWQTCKVMYEQGSWKESLLVGSLAAGSMLAAGTVVAAPLSAGLAVCSAWIAHKRVKPVVDTYYKEKEINGKDYKFKDFYKAHTGDFWKAFCYSVAGVTGVVSGVVGAVAPFVNPATDTAVILNGVRGAATTTRLAAMPAAATTPYVIDYFNADTKEKRKTALKNIAIAGGLSAAGIAGAFFGADLIGDANASEVAPADGASADAPHAPVHTEWGNGDNNDWRHPWGENTGIGDAPADTSADGTAEGSSAEASDAYVHQYETRIPTDAEQAFYESRTSLVPNPDAMIANVEGEIVHLPEGMTAEQAIHLAAMDKLYYGDDTALKLLLDCDTVKGINAEEYFNNLHDKFVTDMNAKNPMGFPTDPNYQADPNIHGKITHVDCDDVKVKVIRDGEVVEVPMSEVKPNIPGAEIPKEANVASDPNVTNPKSMHLRSGAELVKNVTPPSGNHPDFNVKGFHSSSTLSTLTQIGGNTASAEPLVKPEGLTNAGVVKAIINAANGRKF